LNKTKSNNTSVETLIIYKKKTESLNPNLASVNIDPSPSTSSNFNDLEIIPDYEVVSADTILFPKEKYKYYYPDYNKETNGFHPKTLGKPETKDVFVYRGRRLVPLSSVVKNQQEQLEAEKENLELVYVYDEGKLLVVGGSIVKVDPTKAGTVRARVVLPTGGKSGRKFGTEKPLKEEFNSVYIDEKLATFALSALKKQSDLPQFTHSFRKLQKGYANKKAKLGYKYQQGMTEPGMKKTSIADTLTEKLDLDPQLTYKSRFGSFGTNKKGLNKDKPNVTDDKNLYKKNMDRFPSLFREMKRLNMNFVNFEEVCDN